MRFHVVGLPHVHTDGTFSACAYTNKVIGFCKMMKARGHTVFLYAGDRNKAPCDEHISCIPDVWREKLVGDQHYTSADWNSDLKGWQIFNRKAIGEITQRLEERDFICIIGGFAHKPIFDAFPEAQVVEFGVGYGGCFSPFKVFESYAWMHSIYGRGNPVAADGNWWDAVIPGYLDPDEFPFWDGKQPEFVGICDPEARGHLGPRAMPDGSFEMPTKAEEEENRRQTVLAIRHCNATVCYRREGKGAPKEPGSYYLYIGRLIDRKGYRTAIETCKQIGAKLVVAGPLSNDCPTPPEGCDYVGVVDSEMRGILMAGAIATFVPTQYIEPFGNVAIESMACGTPVLTTDFGAFTETNIHGVTGFRCHTLGEFMKAAEDAKNLDRATVRKLCLDRYSLDVIGEKYERYFQRLLHLWGDGWYTKAA